MLNPATLTCASCNSILLGCLTCSSLTTCTLCDASLNFQLSGTNCVCATGYYLNGITCLLCSTAITNCVACTGATTCTVCSSGYYQTGGTCVACAPSCPTCIGTSTNCTSCYPTYTLVSGMCLCAAGTYLDRVTLVCAACQFTCLTCNGPSSTNCQSCDPLNSRTLVGTACPCVSGYNDVGVALCVAPPGTCNFGYQYDTSTGTCLEICGDARVFTLPCDDGNLLEGDGCSATCTVETNYTCAFGSPNTPSVCSYNQPVRFTLINTQKKLASNQVQFDFTVEPPLSPLRKLDFSTVISTTLQDSAQLSFAYDGNGSLMVTAQYNSSIQGRKVSLVFSPSDTQGMFFATPNSSLGFSVEPTNNLAADYYDDGVYSTMGAMNIACYALLGLSLACFAAGLIAGKFIGVEAVGVVQAAFLGLACVEYLPPLLAPLAGIGAVNGYNMPLGDAGTLPYRIGILGFGAALSHSLNISLVILALPMLVAASLEIASRIYLKKNDTVKSEKTHNWALLACCEWGLTAVMFVLYHATASVLVFAMYGGDTSIGMAVVEAAVWATTTIAVAVLFKVRSDSFADYRKAFKPDKFSQSHYWILMGGRLLLAAILVLANSVSVVCFVGAAVPLAQLVYIAVRKPYLQAYNNGRAIANEGVLFAVLVLYGCYRAALSRESYGQSFFTALAWIEVLLLIGCVATNAGLMIKYWIDSRKETKETAKQEEAAKVEKLEETDQEQFLKIAKLHRNIGPNVISARFDALNSYSSIKPEALDLSQNTNRANLEQGLLDKSATIVENSLYEEAD